MILGTGIKVGDSIKWPAAWSKVIEVTADGAMTSAGFVKFGSRIYGWKK